MNESIQFFIIVAIVLIVAPFFIYILNIKYNKDRKEHDEKIKKLYEVAITEMDLLIEKIRNCEQYKIKNGENHE